MQYTKAYLFEKCFMKLILNHVNIKNHWHLTAEHFKKAVRINSSKNLIKGSYKPPLLDNLNQNSNFAKIL